MYELEEYYMMLDIIEKAEKNRNYALILNFCLDCYTYLPEIVREMQIKTGKNILKSYKPFIYISLYLSVLEKFQEYL